MREIEFNKKSWHYRLATVYAGNQTYNSSANICPYIRSVIAGMASVGIIICAGSLFSLLLLCPIFAGIISYAFGFESLTEELKAYSFVGGLGWIAILVVIGVCVALENETTIIRKINRIFPSDSFIRVAWRSIHDKLCFRVYFK